jgi:ABC-type multidrug transport system ATPase subunit
MKIFFLRREGLTEKFIKGDRIELYPDTPWDSNGHPWDDYGYRTTFEAKLFYKDKEYDLPNIKILIENKTNTHDVFKKSLKKSKKKYIGFPLKKINYISLPTDILWYKTLYSLAENNKDNSLIGDTLKILHDANYIKYKDIENKSYALLESEGFKVSLLRDMTARNSFEQGWLALEEKTRLLQKEISFFLEFHLDSFLNYHKIEINFKKSIFPNNINILIGSNGTGKSQTLSYLIDSLLGIGNSIQLKKIPSFNQIVVIAYSPFESFRTTLKDVDINVKSVYKYFGFRDEEKNFDEKLPSANSVNSLLSMLQDDLDLDFLLDRPNKYDTFMKVIGEAIDFDYIGLAIKEEFPDLEPYDYNEIIDSKYYVIKDKNQFVNEIDEYQKYFKKKKGLVFVKNDKVINLSSGQEIFAQLISSIIGSIREDTILLIDEPELYLHPNLEVELIDLLKELLYIYKSYAIIATHSSIVAREVPQDYITVLKLKEEEKKIKISRPPFETFGGDIERINSYVFFDKDIEKPFEKWLQKLVNDAGGAKEAIKQYKNELNEESIILMYGMKVDNAD